MQNRAFLILLLPLAILAASLACYVATPAASPEIHGDRDGLPAGAFSESKGRNSVQPAVPGQISTVSNEAAAIYREIPKGFSTADVPSSRQVSTAQPFFSGKNNFTSNERNPVPQRASGFGEKSFFDRQYDGPDVPQAQPTLRGQGGQISQAVSQAGQGSAGPLSGATQPPRQAPVPAVMVLPDPALGLNDQQLAGLESLRNQFIEAVGGASQDPADPQYLQRWEEAAPVYDDRVKALYGTTVYNSLVLTGFTQQIQESIQGPSQRNP